MRITALTVAAAVLALSAATSANAYDNQYAALAIDHNAGDQWGWAVNHYTQGEADRAALNECGRNCRVVLRFYGGCGAYAVERGNDSLYGWGLAATKEAAQNRALAEVRARGGRDNMVRVWGCNGG